MLRQSRCLKDNAMATEIERKFLVRNDDWRTDAPDGVAMRQGYLAGNDQCSIRVRISGDQAHLNIKSATLGVTRTEYEYSIPVNEADEMLNNLCAGPLIEKVRHHVKHGQHVWDIDVFEGDNRDLVVAEIELKDKDEPFDRPAWLGEEVSDDPRYYNVCLVSNPYKNWRNDR